MVLGIRRKTPYQNVRPAGGKKVKGEEMNITKDGSTGKKCDGRGSTAEMEKIRQLAESGDDEAQYQLGIAYYEGKDATKDYAEALRWLMPAAEQEHAAAQYYLGLMYNNGHGVTRDVKEAVKWFRLAAEQGLANAQAALGLVYRCSLLYRCRDDVPMNIEEAIRWLKMAAVQGNTVALCELCNMYLEGVNFTFYDEEAMKWFMLARRTEMPERSTSSVARTMRENL